MSLNVGLIVPAGRRWILLTFPGQQTESLAAQGQSLTLAFHAFRARAVRLRSAYVSLCCRAGRLIVGARGRPNHVTDAFQLSSSYAKVPTPSATYNHA